MFTWLANAMSDYFEVTYCNLGNTKPFYDLNDRVRYVQMNSKRSQSFVGRNTLGLLKNIRDIRRTVKKGHYDLVVNFADHALYALLIAKKIDKFKVLLSQRVDPYSCVKRTDVFRLKMYKYFEGVVCQTESAMAFFDNKKYSTLRKVVIPNPALGKTNEKWDKDNNQGYIVSLARIDLEQKRQDILLKAMKIVHRRFPDVKMRLYGKDVHGSLEILNKMIDELELNDCVSYCGVTDDSYLVLKNACMITLSSDYEGIPNVLIEAMEVGVPIISTDCKPGGARLLIDTNDKGIIVERDSPKKMADAIMFYLKNPDTAADYANNAHRSLSRFSENEIAAKWKMIIDSV